MPFQGKAPTVVVRPSLEEQVRAHLEGRTIDAVSLRNDLLTLRLSGGEQFCVVMPGGFDLENADGRSHTD